MVVAFVTCKGGEWLVVSVEVWFRFRLTFLLCGACAVVDGNLSDLNWSSKMEGDLNKSVNRLGNGLQRTSSFNGARPPEKDWGDEEH